MLSGVISSFFFFNDTATTEIYTLSLHDALPILPSWGQRSDTLQARISRNIPTSSRNPSSVFENSVFVASVIATPEYAIGCDLDRKSTRLNSSHSQISYAVFCLKKKTINTPSSRS